MKLNKYIDHTLLKSTAREEDIRKLCAEAREYDFASVCINPCYVPLAKELLAGSDVKVSLLGGDLIVNYTPEKITLTGNAKLVFEGSFEY